VKRSRKNKKYKKGVFVVAAPLSEKKTAEQREGRNFVRRERKTRKMSKSGSYNPYIFPRTGSVLLDPI